MNSLKTKKSTVASCSPFGVLLLAWKVAAGALG